MTRIITSSESIIAVIAIVDRSDGTLYTGALWNTAGLNLYVWCPQSSGGSWSGGYLTITKVVLTNETDSYSAGQFGELSNMPGFYRVDLPDLSDITSSSGPIKVGGSFSGYDIVEVGSMTMQGTSQSTIYSNNVAIKADTDNMNFTGSGASGLMKVDVQNIMAATQPAQALADSLAGVIQITVDTGASTTNIPIKSASPTIQIANAVISSGDVQREIFFKDGNLIGHSAKITANSGSALTVDTMPGTPAEDDIAVIL